MMKRIAICMIIGVGMATCACANEKTTTEQCLPGYTKDLKDLALKAECRIRKIDARIGPAAPEPPAAEPPAETAPAAAPSVPAAAAPEPATPAPETAPLQQTPAPTPAAAEPAKALHSSWYKDGEPAKKPVPEEPGIGALIEKRN